MKVTRHFPNGPMKGIAFLMVSVSGACQLIQQAMEPVVQASSSKQECVMMDMVEMRTRIKNVPLQRRLGYWTVRWAHVRMKQT